MTSTARPLTTPMAMPALAPLESRLDVSWPELVNGTVTEPGGLETVVGAEETVVDGHEFVLPHLEK